MNEIQEDIDNQGNSENIEHKSEQKKKKNKFAVKEEITEENCKFEEGQILKFVRVRFPGHAKSYAFLVGKRVISYGQKVLAMSDRGMAVGYINSFPYDLEFKKDMLPLRSINKVATESDIEKELETYKRQKEIETTCQNLIDKHELKMNLTHVEFTQYGKKVVFYFVAPSRVDFRGLVKDLVSELKLRIELRQISVRDRAASQGAIGPCGRELCCSSFLSKYGNVSIKMAKNQNLTLNYSKLNGVCGQLKCCLSYEDDVYSGKRKKLPHEGSIIKTKNGDTGKVRKLNILAGQFDLLTDKGRIRRYTFDQFDHPIKDDKVKFPHRFDNISDETANIIGLADLESRYDKQLKRDMGKIQNRAKKFAYDRIIEIADFLPEQERAPFVAEPLKEEKDEWQSSPTHKSATAKEKVEVGVEESQKIDSNQTKEMTAKDGQSSSRGRNNNRRGNNHRRNRSQGKKGPNNNNRRHHRNKNNNKNKSSD